MQFLQLSDVDLRNKRVMIREDLNVPMENGKIINATRILAALPTIKQALSQGAAVILLSHLGRPNAGAVVPEFSLAPVASYLSEQLGQPVKLVTDWVDGIEVQPHQVVLCENVRFNAGEMVNEPHLAAKMGELCDVFVMDAFASAHRAQASTYGVAIKAPIAVAGPLLVAEINALTNACVNPKPPVVAIVGGSKVSTKLVILRQLVTQVDYLILGGGLANTFLAATGLNVGHSLYEPNLIEEVKQVLAIAAQHGCHIPLPLDAVVSTSLTPSSVAEIKLTNHLSADDMIGDIGPQTMSKYCEIIATANTIIWNGPVGIFEYAAFENGTKALALAIADSHAFSLAGGGDTIAAIDKYNLADKISYISTGGGAFLEFLEGRSLPGIEILSQRAMLKEESEHAETQTH